MPISRYLKDPVTQAPLPDRILDVLAELYWGEYEARLEGQPEPQQQSSAQRVVKPTRD